MADGVKPANAKLSLGVALDRVVPFCAFFAIIAVWEGACRLFQIPYYLLPSPRAIAAAAMEITPAAWIDNVWATIHVAVLGFMLAIVVSLPLAMFLVVNRFMYRTILPLLVVVQSTPIVAIGPIIVVMLGTSDLSRIAITFLISFFPIVIATVTGLEATPVELIELSRSLRAGRKREMLQLRLPYAVPFVLSALKTSTALSIIGAVVAEFVSAEHGLGYLILFSTSSFKIPTAFAALCVLIGCSLAMFYGVGLVQNLFFKWSVRK